MYNEVYYWRNYWMKEKEFPLKNNSYIVKFGIVNQETSDIFNKWFSFPSKVKLLGFIEYIILPSIYISKLLEEELIDDGGLVIDSALKSDILDFALLKCEGEEYKQIEEEIEDDYEMIEELKLDFSFEQVKDLVNGLNYRFGPGGLIFLSLDIFENVENIGKDLVTEFKEDGIIDILEDEVNMKEEEILNLFSNIKGNPFMSRKIIGYLDRNFNYL